MDSKTLVILIMAIAIVGAVGIMVIFESGTSNSTSASTNHRYQYITTITNSSDCRPVIVGTDGSGSTGGSCSNYSVTIGTGGTYENYGSACPSQVTIGTDATYYNNATGCNPQVIVGTDAKYYNINK